MFYKFRFYIYFYNPFKINFCTWCGAKSKVFFFVSVFYIWISSSCNTISWNDCPFYIDLSLDLWPNMYASIPRLYIQFSCFYVYIYTHIYIFQNPTDFIFNSVDSLYVCIYIYIHIYVCIHTHTHIYTHQTPTVLITVYIFICLK